MPTVNELPPPTPDVYGYGRDRTFTKAEFDALTDEYFAAVDRDDDETAERLIKQIPMDADTMMAFASVYGRGFVLEGGFDITETNMKYGENWINEIKP